MSRSGRDAHPRSSLAPTLAGAPTSEHLEIDESELWVGARDQVLEAVHLHGECREEEDGVALKDELRVELGSAGSARSSCNHLPQLKLR